MKNKKAKTQIEVLAEIRKAMPRSRQVILSKKDKMRKGEKHKKNLLDYSK